MQNKVCSIPYRGSANRLEVLAFLHPLAGRQFVKGSIERGESPEKAAARELYEESGIAALSAPEALGQSLIGPPQGIWHFYAFAAPDLPHRWDHWTEDGGGLTFSFFWHPLSIDLDGGWNDVFHAAFQFVRSELPKIAANSAT